MIDRTTTRRRMWGLLMPTVAMLLAASVGARNAEAAAGDLDPRFGNGGKVITDFNGQTNIATDVKVQLDGKIVVVGSAESLQTFTNEFAIARYNPNGSLDATFGTGGRVTTDFGANDGARAVAIGLDGKIVVAGVSQGFPFSQIAIARYNRDGSLDATFGLGGKVITNFGGFFAEAHDVALTLDGKIVVAGVADVDWAILRYNRDGSLDTTFNGTGELLSGFGSQGAANSIKVMLDGRLVVGGNLFPVLQSTFALVRVNRDGSLDDTFGNGGIVTTAFPGLACFVNDIAIRLDGKIVAVGSNTSLASKLEIALARYEPNGTLDQQFGTNGLATVFVNSVGQSGIKIAQQFDGKIVVPATVFPATGFTDLFAVLRFNPNGTLDQGWGQNGIAVVPFSNPSAPFPSDIANAAAIGLDGKVVAVGSTFASPLPNGGVDFAIARFAFSF